jgi:FMN phosphatase YigB (HAD superfamily)
MANQLKGILFDFDDTLIDWSGVDFNWRELEASHLANVHAYINSDIQPFDVELKTLTDRYMERTKDAWAEGRSTLRAPNMPKVLMDTVVELGVPEDKLDLAALIKAYDWKVVPGTVVFADVPPMLENLIANDIKLGIVTNASQPMSMRDTELVSHKLIDYFPDCRLSAADAGYLKPHPHIFEHALDVLGTNPEETIFIGDNPIADIAGAQSAGMQAILRVKMTTQKMISGLIVPDAAINSMVELPHILDDWFPEWRKNGN